MLSACSAPSTLAYDQSDAVTEAPLVAPSGPVVLTVSGDISMPNVGDQTLVDQATLDSMPHVAIDAFEPFVNKTISFTGIPADRFLASLGIAPNTPLVFRALDNYETTYTRSQLAKEGAVVATHQDGNPIPVEEGGPIRLVFPRNDGPISVDGNQWIWSISEIVAG